MNRIIGAFDTFNPITDSLPDSLLFKVGYQYQRALAILSKDLEEQDINLVLEFIEDMLKIGDEKLHDWNEQLIGDRGWAAHTETLKLYIAHECLREPITHSKRKIEWSDVFAVSTLVNIANLFELTLEPTGTNAVSEHIISELPLEAMESIAYAETFKAKETTRLKRSQSVKKSNNNKYHPLKLEIVTLFNKLPNDLPDRQAAIVIIEQLSPDAKLRFSTENGLGQIQTWLGQYKKGKLPGQEKLPPYKPIVSRR